MRIVTALQLVLLSAMLCAGPRGRAQRTYLGCDLNTYPGDEALPILRKSFVFAGYWLSPPPGVRENTWIGKRQALNAQGFGFVLLYAGPQGKALKSATQAEQNAMRDAQSAARTAKKEGFPTRSIIFLDVEEGGRLPETYYGYLRGWTEELARVGFRAGVYCSGIPVNEGAGATITTADDIRRHIGRRELTYWVFNDVCPPAPGCVVAQDAPAPSASGVEYAAIWQFAQSPRRQDRTAPCAATYHRDGNCYAPGDKSHAWFLDVNSATTPDPSGTR